MGGSYQQPFLLFFQGCVGQIGDSGIYGGQIVSLIPVGGEIHQATSFEVGASLSINYTFGSIYSNVVNPRFNRY